jgi:hypothetical protein
LWRRTIASSGDTAAAPPEPCHGRSYRAYTAAYFPRPSFAPTAGCCLTPGRTPGATACSSAGLLPLWVGRRRCHARPLAGSFARAVRDEPVVALHIPHRWSLTSTSRALRRALLPNDQEMHLLRRTTSPCLFGLEEGRPRERHASAHALRSSTPWSWTPCPASIEVLLPRNTRVGLWPPSV